MARLLGIWGLTLLMLLVVGAQPAMAQSAPAQSLKRDAAVALAIREASWATGVEYEFLLAKAHLESGLDADAKANTSSAAGLFQFIEGTWLANVARYRSELDLDAHAKVGAGEALTNSDWLALRFDPRIAALVAAASTRENAASLRKVLGRRPSHSELYMAHFLGSAGAARFMRAWQRDPSMSAAALFPKAARSNRPIFFSGGKPRSLGAVLGHFDAKIAAAISVAQVELEPALIDGAEIDNIATFQIVEAATSLIIEVSPSVDSSGATTDAEERIGRITNVGRNILNGVRTPATPPISSTAQQAVFAGTSAEAANLVADPASAENVSAKDGISSSIFDLEPMNKATTAPEIRA